MGQTNDREFVVLESFAKYDDDQLVDVQMRLEAEAVAVIAELRAENKRRSEVAIEAALARAQRSGVKVAAQPSATGEEPKRRGRRTKAEIAAEEAAKANGHDDVDAEELADEDLAQA